MEARYVAGMARRIAAILLMTPELNANHAATKQACFEWAQGTNVAASRRNAAAWKIGHHTHDAPTGWTRRASYFWAGSEAPAAMIGDAHRNVFGSVLTVGTRLPAIASATGGRLKSNLSHQYYFMLLFP